MCTCMRVCTCIEEGDVLVQNVERVRMRLKMQCRHDCVNGKENGNYDIQSLFTVKHPHINPRFPST